MYIVDWEEFFAAATKLLAASPNSRYLIKYRHKDGKIVFKITNDVVCIKHRSDQAETVKQMEKLNNLLMKSMTKS